jgi:hypothetical protein
MMIMKMRMTILMTKWMQYIDIAIKNVAFARCDTIVTPLVLGVSFVSFGLCLPVNRP